RRAADIRNLHGATKEASLDAITMTKGTLYLAMGLCLPVVWPEPMPSAPENRVGSKTSIKSPIDISVDDKGETATVLLLGTRSIATVDLATGKIKKDVLADRRMLHPAAVSYHLEYIDPVLRKYFAEAGFFETD